MTDFIPNYQNIVNAAKNIEPERVPLYEHIISFEVIEKILDTHFAHLYESNDISDIRKFFKNYCRFFIEMGYDTVSWEICIGPAMPESGALYAHKPGVIKNRKDFENYPWDKVEEIYFEKQSMYFEILREQIPENMKAIGGPGNGVFECVQDLVGYERLCILSHDEPELYHDLFKKVGDTNYNIWKRFLEQFGDIYAVCRFGDDLGYRSSTLLPPDDIRANIIPQYKRIIDLVHSHDKSFLFHCCGAIFDIMDDIINVAGIDAKHSNEDIIAPFSVWLDKYSDRIGNFGGVDMDILCQLSPKEVERYTNNVLDGIAGHGGIAIGSGNSIPDYIPVEGYMAMINTIRKWRGDY